jgi:hypothetical protein
MPDKACLQVSKNATTTKTFSYSHARNCYYFTSPISASQFGKTPKGTKRKETKTMTKKKKVFKWGEKRERDYLEQGVSWRGS